MAVGAGVVQFCTAVMHHGFRIIDDLRSGMSHYLDDIGFAGVQDIRRRALPHIGMHDDLPRRKVRSYVHESSCVGCEACYVACRDGGHMAIEQRISRIPRVDVNLCVGCGLCAHVCPVDDCIEMEVA